MTAAEWFTFAIGVGSFAAVLTAIWFFATGAL